MTDDREVGNLEQGTCGTTSGWMAAVEADPRYGRFSVDEAEATFAGAGFARVPKEDSAWGDTLPGTGWPCACFERHGVGVAAHRLSYQVFSPGDGSPMASFPDAELAIRFVRAFERDAELMAADGFSDEQFDRVQILAAEVMEEALEAIEETRKRLRDWMGLEGEERDAGPDGLGRDPTEPGSGAAPAAGERAPGP